MGADLRIEGVRDGRAVQLPQNLDAVAMTTAKGTIHIDLAEPVENMVPMRASLHPNSPDVMRPIMSRVDSGHLAVGVIRTPT